MKRRNALFAVVFVVSLLIGIQAVEVVEANPIVPYPEVPNTDLPSMTVVTPANPLPLKDNNTVAINITVIQPDTWLHYYMGLKPIVGKYYGYVSLDGEMKLGDVNSQGKVCNFNISFTGYPDTVLRICGYNRSFTGEPGQHKLTIQLNCKTFSQIGNYQSKLAQDVSFTIDSSSQAISFLETPVRIDRGIYPTANPSSSPTPTITTSIIILVTYVTVIGVVASISLVYFKRMRGKS